MKNQIQGRVKNVVLVARQTKHQKNFDEIVETLKANEFYIMRPKYSLNSVYTLLRKIKEKTGIEATWGETESGQYAIHQATKEAKVKPKTSKKKAKKETPVVEQPKQETPIETLVTQ